MGTWVAIASERSSAVCTTRPTAPPKNKKLPRHSRNILREIIFFLKTFLGKLAPRKSHFSGLQMKQPSDLLCSWTTLSQFESPRPRCQEHENYRRCGEANANATDKTAGTKRMMERRFVQATSNTQHEVPPAARSEAQGEASERAGGRILGNGGRQALL